MICIGSSVMPYTFVLQNTSDSNPSKSGEAAVCVTSSDELNEFISNS